MGDINQLSNWVRPERQTTIVASTWPKTLSDLAQDLCFAGGLPVRFRAQAKPPGAQKKKIMASAKPDAGAKKVPEKSVAEAAADTEAAAEPAEEPPPELATEAEVAVEGEEGAGENEK